MQHDFGHWFAGFIDGEGSFVIQRVNNGALRCFLALCLRADDRAILEEIQARYGGVLRYRNTPSRARSSSSPELLLRFQRKQECLDLISLLDVHPLRSRKARDYEQWRAAVLLWSQIYHGGDTTRQADNAPLWHEMEALRLRLNGGRIFRQAA